MWPDYCKKLICKDALHAVHAPAIMTALARDTARDTPCGSGYDVYLVRGNTAREAQKCVGGPQS